MKDVPSIEFPKRALDAAAMRLHWKADRHDKPVYVEDDKIVLLYVVAYKREHGKPTTMQKGVNEDPWYHQIVRNFALPRDEDLSAKPLTGAGELTNLGIGPESKKKKRAPAVTTAQKKLDVTKAKVPREEKKGTRHFSESWCDNIVVSDTLEGFTPVALWKPKAEPRDTADLPVPNPDDPIEMDSSPEPLLRTKAVKKKSESEAVAHPDKKIIRKRISKKGNLVAFSMKLSPEETLGDYYYGSYSERKASKIHAPVWKLKQGDTFSDWQICRDWLQGVFPPAEVKFQEDRSHDQTYHAYLEETASSTSTTCRIVREWRSVHKEWTAFEALKKEVSEEKAKVAMLRSKLEADLAKFESEQKTEEWSTARWKRKEKLSLKLLFFQKSVNVGWKFVIRIIMRRWFFGTVSTISRRRLRR
ncbi:hypothetical protein HanRHA438_Chr08g0367571 [Helianthus annuus]|uniref:Uncharacterized protein n=1 Tax=Helianthus annuus TaxID=4232 RepID=A0A9K3IH33_HELAN|nr:hypothetical protein HanXRQr2_Chr08g0355481 [Helianthus annuus]KAJ0540031.1 hypothetical protein HanHA300_Chr08g0293531 [Helianthus annuus]KAJ0548418.1 hypothetical protein HanIR_Chr08g0383541 [Helianthus annuus]KAJ0554769.1 hypothetical protein HanHA89_Chr08g0311981 [Helianthus annuus]KAJ0720337.1 hypothetical protein HanLR1_Chr08g0292331 [Helianthus annuus]